MNMGVLKVHQCMVDCVGQYLTTSGKFGSWLPHKNRRGRVKDLFIVILLLRCTGAESSRDLVRCDAAQAWAS